MFEGRGRKGLDVLYKYIKSLHELYDGVIEESYKNLKEMWDCCFIYLIIGLMLWILLQIFSLYPSLDISPYSHKI